MEKKTFYIFKNSEINKKLQALNIIIYGENIFSDIYSFINSKPSINRHIYFEDIHIYFEDIHYSKIDNLNIS